MQRFEAGTQPNNIQVDDFAAIALFYRLADYRVSNDRIMIQRGCTVVQKPR